MECRVAYDRFKAIDEFVDDEDSISRSQRRREVDLYQSI